MPVAIPPALAVAGITGAVQLLGQSPVPEAEQIARELRKRLEYARGHNKHVSYYSGKVAKYQLRADNAKHRDDRKHYQKKVRKYQEDLAEAQASLACIYQELAVFSVTAATETAITS